MGDKANIDFTTSLPNNGNRNTEGGLTDPHSLASYFGRLSYNFAERYMLQLTVRRDGSFHASVKITSGVLSLPFL